MKIDIVLMASGYSRRFGNDNKLFHKVKGREMFSIALENGMYLKKNCPDIIDKIIVVSRFEAVKALCKYPVKYVHNSESYLGISASIRYGVLNSDSNNAIMFMTCDQPYMTGDVLCEYARSFVSGNKGIATLIDSKGNFGNPCIFSPNYRQELYTLEGDKGGRMVLLKHKADVFKFEVSPIALRDIDIPLDYIEDFDFVNEKGHIISITGAGGKTTLMYSLAELFASKGQRVLVTTTTHIYKPDIVAYSVNDAVDLWSKGKYAVVGSPCDNGKLSMPDNIEEFISVADTVLIEADGARHLPIKVPDDREPVILDKSDIIINVTGIDALNKPLGNVCFRAGRAMEILECDIEHIVTTENMAELISHSRGGYKYAENRDFYAIINKCDDYELIKKGNEIKKLLNKKGIKAFVMSLRGDIDE